MKHNLFIYMEVSMDDKELPMAVADSAAELSRMVGVHPSYVTNSIYRYEKEGKKSRFVRVRREA